MSIRLALAMVVFGFLGACATDEDSASEEDTGSQIAAEDKSCNIQCAAFGGQGWVNCMNTCGSLHMRGE